MQKPENSQKVINVDKKQPSRSKQQSLLDAQILTKKRSSTIKIFYLFDSKYLAQVQNPIPYKEVI